MRARKEKGITDVYLNEHRKTILELCRDKPKKIIELEKILQLGHGTVMYHINFLAKLGLITLEKKGNEVGRPTYIKTSVQGFKDFYGKKSTKTTKENERAMRKILSYIKEKQTQGYSVYEWGIYSKFANEIDYFDILKAMNLLKVEGHLGLVVTETGEKFLKTA